MTFLLKHDNVTAQAREGKNSFRANPGAEQNSGKEELQMTLTNKDLMAISNLMDRKLHPINSRLDSIESRLDKIECRLDKVESRLDKVEGRLDKVESRLDHLESDMSAMKVGQAELRQHLKEIDQKVSETYQLALDAWGTSIENRNWLETSRLKA